MIKAIFFDFEGVITNNPMILHKDLYKKIENEISFEEFDKRYSLARIGKIKYAEFMKGFEKYEPYIFSLIKFRKGAKKTLNYFQSKKVPMILASNHIDGLAEMEVEKLGIGKYFNKMFFSHRMGLKKPEESFFLEMLKECGIILKKNEMLFIDDAKRNLIVAKKLGFVTIYLPNGIEGDTRNKVEFKADYEINNITEMIPIFEKLNK